jgi:hypothetical protein
MSAERPGSWAASSMVRLRQEAARSDIVVVEGWTPPA